MFTMYSSRQLKSCDMCLELHGISTTAVYSPQVPQDKTFRVDFGCLVQ
jgi:hypothetical protein